MKLQPRKLVNLERTLVKQKRCKITSLWCISNLAQVIDN